MGLLDNLSNFAASDQGMALAQGLLSANGSQGIAAGLAGMQRAKQYEQEMSMKKQFQAMQMENYASEIAQRKAAIQKQESVQEMMRGIFGGGQSPMSRGAFDTPAVDGVGPTMPQSMQRQAQNPGLANASIDQIAALKAIGNVDLMDAYKWVKEPQELKGGSTYENRTTGKREMIAKLPEGMVTGQDGRATVVPDFLPGIASIAGATKSAEARATANNTPLSLDFVDQATGRPIGGTVGSYVSGQGAPQAAQMPQAAPQAAPMPKMVASEAQMRTAASGDMGADPKAIEREIAKSTNDMMRVKDPAVRQQLSAYVQDLKRQQSALPSMGLQSKAEAEAAKETAVLAPQAQSKINDTWLKSSYEPVLQMGKDAQRTMENVQISRQALANMGSTGWGTEAKATAANVLSGLGIAPENAKMFAANAQKFQQVATDRLWTTLNSAKGPQTEGDADRAKMTWAQLKNTPEANAFIMDLMEARAQRDSMQAKFYQNGLPIAQQRGKLNELDGEWSNRMPSIYDMPSMKKWAK